MSLAPPITGDPVLIEHLLTDHGIKPWDIGVDDAHQRDHHDRLHSRPRKPLTHTHDTESTDGP